MLGEFLLRLAVALPLVCGLAALCLWSVKRGWLPMPGFALRSPHATAPRTARDSSPLDLIATRSLGPGARLAVVRFDGRDHLVGQSGAAMILIASTAPLQPEQAACVS
ncbi:MAG: hypothetical protein DI568_04515 [Sphingomonas sp.]|nr:MAG: hypothetical protein DI568_04515 [Sphingomonas sp.]